MKNLKAVKFDDTPDSLSKIYELVDSTNSAIERIDRSDLHNPYIVIRGSNGETFELHKGYYLVKYVDIFTCNEVDFEENTDLVTPNEYVLTGKITPAEPRSKFIKVMARLTAIIFFVSAYLLGALGMGVIFLAINWALKNLFDFDIIVMSSGTAFMFGFFGCIIIRLIEEALDNMKKSDESEEKNYAA